MMMNTNIEKKLMMVKRKTQRPNDLAILTLAFAIAIDVYYIMHIYIFFSFFALLFVALFFFFLWDQLRWNVRLNGLYFVFSLSLSSEQILYASKLLHIVHRKMAAADTATTAAATINIVHVYYFYYYQRLCRWCGKLLAVCISMYVFGMTTLFDTR